MHCSVASCVPLLMALHYSYVCRKRGHVSGGSRKVPPVTRGPGRLDQFRSLDKTNALLTSVPQDLPALPPYVDDSSRQWVVMSQDLLRSRSFRSSVSSVLNRNVKEFGKGYLFDGRDDTCWNSDQGSPQWVVVAFEEPVTVRAVEITFQVRNRLVLAQVRV